MFVFPAFNSNYKTRKRTFKCCQNCRIKRIKCEITSSNYEVEGCTNCLKNKLKCNLIKDKRQIKTEPSQPPAEGYCPTPNPSSTESVMEYSPIGKVDLDVLLITDETKINARFLKEMFNFNICSEDKALTYQYVYHHHPKYIISNKLDDNSIWHESGVIVDNKPDAIYKTYKAKDDNCIDKFHLRSIKVYRFLLSINAFLLSHPEFPITDYEITDLVNIYFKKINSIFPVVNENEFRKDFESGNAPTVLLYAIILIILRDSLAEPILLQVFKRADPGMVFTQKQFTKCLMDHITDLEYKIRQILLILPQLGDGDKLTRLEVLLLLSLHFNSDKMGHEQAAHDVTDAINLAESLALHMKRVNLEHSKRNAASNLWWCCYVFDRFSAIVCGRQIFINSDDFNIDLPSDNIHLLKMVQLARSLEKLCAIYQPFKNSVIDSEGIKVYNKFNFEEFQRMEFLSCDQERAGHNNLNLTGSEVESTSRLVHFISRIVSNFIIIGSQKSKYDNTNCDKSIPDYNSARAAANMLWYHMKMSNEDLINIPLIPYMLSISMAVCLKMITKKYITNANNLYDSDDVLTFEQYMNEFDRYAGKWSVFDELCTLSKNYVHKLASNSQLIKETNIRFESSEMNLKGYDNDPFAATHSNPNITRIKSQSSINNILQSPVEKFLMNSPTLNIPMNEKAKSQFDDNRDHEYIDSLQVDIFDNDLFRDLPNMVNFLD